LQIVDESPDSVLDRAYQVAWLVVPGIDARTSWEALELAEVRPDRVRAAVGLHPDCAHRWDAERPSIVQLIPRAVAIGETGLDFYRSLASRETQLTAFRELLNLAVEYDKPLIVHCRDAFREVHEIIEKAAVGQRAVMHCWSGGPQWTRRFLDLGVMFSFAGPVLVGSDDMIRRGAAQVPPERAMVETDAPHLCPRNGRAKPNDPSRIGLVGAALALLWGLTCNDVARITSANAGALFEPVGNRHPSRLMRGASPDH
jgi:TatD DNase family protein